MHRFCHWILVGFLLCTSPTYLSAQSLSLFIQPPSNTKKDTQAQLWVEGVVSDTLRKRMGQLSNKLGEIPAAKQAQQRQAMLAFKIGKKAFEELNPDLSFRKFQQTLRLFRQIAPYANQIETLCRALLYIGVGHLLNGQQANGQKSFEEALSYCPNMTLSGITTENDKLQIFRAAQSTMRRTPRGRLKFTANIPANVFIDGRYRGQTPLTLSLRKGNHIVSIRRAGYVRWGKILNVTQATTQTLNAKLKKVSTFQKWLALGTSATRHVRKTDNVHSSVSAFAKWASSSTLMLLHVSTLQDDVIVHAALYDMRKKKQLAAGGARVEQGTGAVGLRSMVKQLLAGQDPAIGTWSPGLAAPSISGSGPNVGLIVGVAAGAVVVIGGVTAAIMLASPPTCPSGACAQIKLIP